MAARLPNRGALERGPELPILAVIMAPAPEEFLFQGLRRSLGGGTSILVSAAVHPPASAPPVFVFGVAALVHTLCNGALSFAQA